MMIKHIHFNQQFDAERMKREVAALEDFVWQDHFNRGGYEGSWSTLQLRAINGQAINNLIGHAEDSQQENAFQDTPLLAHCPSARSN